MTRRNRPSKKLPRTDGKELIIGKAPEIARPHEGFSAGGADPMKNSVRSRETVRWRPFPGDLANHQKDDSEHCDCKCKCIVLGPISHVLLWAEDFNHR
jgi:hypothetical protein